MLDRKHRRIEMVLPIETRLDRILKTRFWRVLQKAEGRNIIYRQGEAKAELCAIFDSVSEETEEVLKVSLNRTVMEISILKEELSVNGKEILPRPGDRIEEIGQGGSSIFWEVIAGPNQRAWNFSEAGRNIMAIYAQRTES